MKKTNFGINSYGSATPTKWRKLGDALLSVSTAITGFAIYEDVKWLAMAALLLGSAGKFLTNFFSDSDGTNLGHLGSILSLNDAQQLKLTDGWLGLSVNLESDQVGGIFTYPVQTVSQSESGFELVHQCVCVQPHWNVVGDANGKWACRMKLSIETGITNVETKPDQATVKS